MINKTIEIIKSSKDLEEIKTVYDSIRELEDDLLSSNIDTYSEDKKIREEAIKEFNMSWMNLDILLGNHKDLESLREDISDITTMLHNYLNSKKESQERLEEVIEYFSEEKNYENVTIFLKRLADEKF